MIKNVMIVYISICVVLGFDNDCLICVELGKAVTEVPDSEDDEVPLSDSDDSVVSVEGIYYSKVRLHEIKQQKIGILKRLNLQSS